MFVKKDLEKQINELKEDLIHAVNEHYKGELEIEDVTDTSYGKMALTQDKETIDLVNGNIAESISKQIGMLENLIDEAFELDRRTLLRNSEVIEGAIFDLTQSIKILTLSIRKNNALWQVILSDWQAMESEGSEEDIEDKNNSQVKNSEQIEEIKTVIKAFDAILKKIKERNKSDDEQ